MPEKTEERRGQSAERWEGMQLLMDDLITTQKAADLLGVLPKQVWNLLQAERLIGKKFGHDWIVYKPSVDDYLAGKSRKGRPPSKAQKKTRRKLNTQTP